MCTHSRRCRALLLVVDDSRTTSPSTGLFQTSAEGPRSRTGTADPEWFRLPSSPIELNQIFPDSAFPGQAVGSGEYSFVNRLFSRPLDSYKEANDPPTIITFS